MKDVLKFHLERRDYSGYIGMWFAMAHPQGGYSEAETVVFHKRETDVCMQSEPPLKLQFDEAQQLMDELYLAGIRPTQVGTGGELEATKYHLEDMRTLAKATKRE